MITGENPMLRETNQATVIGQVSEPMPNLPFSEFESRLDTTGQDARGNQIREMFLSLKHLIQSMTAKDKERRVASLQRVKEVLQGVYPIAKELASTENLEKKAT
jgi:hypothetical protein